MRAKMEKIHRLLLPSARYKHIYAAPSDNKQRPDRCRTLPPLPYEIWELIAGFSDGESLPQLRLVCREWDAILFELWAKQYLSKLHYYLLDPASLQRLQRLTSLPHLAERIGTVTLCVSPFGTAVEEPSPSRIPTPLHRRLLDRVRGGKEERASNGQDPDAAALVSFAGRTNDEADAAAADDAGDAATWYERASRALEGPLIAIMRALVAAHRPHALLVHFLIVFEREGGVQVLDGLVCQAARRAGHPLPRTMWNSLDGESIPPALPRWASIRDVSRCLRSLLLCPTMLPRGRDREGRDREGRDREGRESEPDGEHAWRACAELLANAPQLTGFSYIVIVRLRERPPRLWGSLATQVLRALTAVNLTQFMLWGAECHQHDLQAVLQRCTDSLGEIALHDVTLLSPEDRWVGLIRCFAHMRSLWLLEMSGLRESNSTKPLEWCDPSRAGLGDEPGVVFCHYFAIQPWVELNSPEHPLVMTPKER